MSPALTAYIYIFLSIAMGSCVSAICFDRALVFKIAIAWFFLITAAIFGNIILVVFVALMIFISVKDESFEVKILYFVALLPVLPLSAYVISVPGIETLWDLKFARVLVLIFLAPMFFIFINKMIKNELTLSLSDTLFLIFVLMNMLVFLRSGNPTLIARLTLNVLVDFAIPYFVISRFLLSPMALNWLLAAFLVSATYVTFFSMIESILGWRFFSQILYSLELSFSPLSLVPYSRGGIVRAAGGAFFQPLAFAYFVSIAFIVTFFMWKSKILKAFPAMMLMGLFFVGVFLSGSRGGLLILMVGVGFLYFMRLNPNLKTLVVFVGGGGLIMAFIYFSVSGFSAVDSEGTFEYRRQLVENSLRVLNKNLFLGSSDYLTDPMLMQSKQGQGIIDIVNMYLQIALEMGLVGLTAFLGCFVMVIRGVWKKTSVIGVDHKDLLLSILVMSLVFIGTCSAVSFIPWYLYLFLAVARAYVGFEEVRAPQNLNARAA